MEQIETFHWLLQDQYNSRQVQKICLKIVWATLMCSTLLYLLKVIILVTDFSFTFQCLGFKLYMHMFYRGNKAYCKKFPKSTPLTFCICFLEGKHF